MRIYQNPLVKHHWVKISLAFLDWEVAWEHQVLRHQSCLKQTEQFESRLTWCLKAMPVSYQALLTKWGTVQQVSEGDKKDCLKRTKSISQISYFQAGLLLCYLNTFILLAKPGVIVCMLQRFSVGMGFRYQDQDLLSDSKTFWSFNSIASSLLRELQLRFFS